jgi:peptidyl-prolyl cis-trans isomerase D
MLQKMRSGSRTWVGVIIAGFLMIMFGFVGMNEFIGGGATPTSTVITVGDGDIDGREYEAEYRRVTNRISTEQRRRITYQDAKKEGLLKQVNENLVAFARARLEVENLGVQVPLEAVARILNLSSIAYPIQSRNDPRALFGRMVQDGMNRGAAISRIRTLIAQSQLQEAIGRVGTVPKSIADRLYKLRNERRVAEVVLVPITAIKEVPKPTEAQLAAYHKANASKYRVPKLRSITALIVRAKDINSQIPVTSAMIKKAYEDGKASYSEPEKREIHQFIVKDEATAKKAVEALLAKKTFDKVAEEIAKSKVRSFGILGPTQISALPFQFKDAAQKQTEMAKILKLEKGQFSGPYKSAFGYHVIIVVDVVPAKLKPLDDVRSQIVEEIRARQRPKLLARWRDRIDDDVTAGDTLEAIAKALKIKVTKIAAMDSKGRGPKGEKIDGLPTARRFLQLSFDQKPGETGDIVDTPDDGGFYIIRVDKETPARVTPLKNIKARVTEHWTLAERRKLAKGLAAKVAAAMREGRSAEGAAKQFELKSQTTRPLVRGASEVSSTGAGYIQDAVFRAKVGGVVTGRSPTGWAVAKVTKVLAPDEKTAKAARKKLLETIEASIGGAILSAFQKSLIAKYPTKIDEEGIDQLFQLQRQRVGG